MPFPLIGEVQAAGLTPTELEARMRELLAKEIPGARRIVARESKEAIRLDARALSAVAQLVGMPDQAKAQYQTVLARQPALEAAARGLASLRNPG
jgi:hypothetical protein